MNRLKVVYDQPEAAQESGFMNATLQSNASNTLAFSIAVHAPDLEIDDQHQLAFILSEAFQPLLDKGYEVEVHIGPSTDQLAAANSDAQRIAALKRVFPGTVKFHDPAEGRWTRPEHLSTEDGEGHDGGAFYYENAEMPPDRFYSETEDEAWLALWDDVGEEADLEPVSRA